MKKALLDLIASEPLRSNVFKVPHHGSKHGLNLELAERIKPAFSFVSCAAGANSHGFPHSVSLEALREALQATTKRGVRRMPDWQLGIHYTGSREAKTRNPLGTIGMVMSSTGRKRLLFRFGDTSAQPVDLSNARAYVGPTRPPR